MKIPNPGSDAAIKKGCICPVLDNAHGKGWMGGVKDPTTGSTLFVYTVGCPVHSNKINNLCAYSKDIE